MSEPTYRSVADPAGLSGRERDAVTGRRVAGRSDKDRSPDSRRPRPRWAVVGAVIAAVVVAGGVAVALASGDGGNDDPVAAGSGGGTSGAGGTDATTGGSTDTEPGETGGGGDQIDLAGVDACDLLDDATLTRITGVAGLISSGGPGSASASTCFWASPVAGQPAYAELTISKGEAPAAGLCPTSRIDGSGSGEAVGGSCTANAQAKVYASVADRGVVVGLLVNEPESSATPTTLVSEIESVIAGL